ncbi:MAG: DUF2889 domain-containing protein [Proteobacteria bacterium]|nr:DUF2889 domain-containing protein [Pseudomonadota bacterium]
MTLRFLRNKVVEVEPRPDGALAVSWRLTDDLLKAEVRLTVQMPEMEIIEAEAELDRFPPRGAVSPSELIKKVEGVNIGGGLRKIVKGVLGGPEGYSVLVDAVLESSNAVILHFTRPGIQAGEAITDPAEKLARSHAMLKMNPRLVRSCIVFQDDSPVMQGLDL